MPRAVPISRSAFAQLIIRSLPLLHESVAMQVTDCHGLPLGFTETEAL
jgi:hypothetical protein